MSTETTEANHFAEIILELTEQSGMTHKALSEASGIPYSSLNRKLKKSPESFTTKEMCQLAVALGHTLEIGFAA